MLSVDALFRRPESVVDEHPAKAITPANKEMPKSALLCFIIRPPFFGFSCERSIFFQNYPSVGSGQFG
jgi:hypothetical protein